MRIAKFSSQQGHTRSVEIISNYVHKLSMNQHLRLFSDKHLFSARASSEDLRNDHKNAEISVQNSLNSCNSKYVPTFICVNVNYVSVYLAA